MSKIRKSWANKRIKIIVKTKKRNKHKAAKNIENQSICKLIANENKLNIPNSKDQDKIDENISQVSTSQRMNEPEENKHIAKSNLSNSKFQDLEYFEEEKFERDVDANDFYYTTPNFNFHYYTENSIDNEEIDKMQENSEQYYENYRNDEMIEDIPPHEYKMILNEVDLYQKLTSEINEEIAHIDLMVDMVHIYKQEIKREIDEIIYQVFSSEHSDVQAHIFGSVATELALPESDVDIVVTGVNCYGSETNLHKNIILLWDSIKKWFNSNILTKWK